MEKISFEHQFFMELKKPQFGPFGLNTKEQNFSKSIWHCHFPS